MFGVKKLNKKDAFQSDRLLFRGIEEQDADTIVQWRSNPTLIQYSFDKIPLTKKRHLQWFSQYKFDVYRLDFLIIKKVTLEPIGIVGLRAIDMRKKEAEISILIGKSQGDGYGVESIRAICQYGKDIFILKRVWAVIHMNNLISIKAFEKAGFQLFEQSEWLRYEIFI